MLASSNFAVWSVFMFNLTMNESVTVLVEENNNVSHHRVSETIWKIRDFLFQWFFFRGFFLIQCYVIAWILYFVESIMSILCQQTFWLANFSCYYGDLWYHSFFLLISLFGLFSCLLPCCFVTLRYPIKA